MSGSRLIPGVSGLYGVRFEEEREELLLFKERISTEVRVIGQGIAPGIRADPISLEECFAEIRIRARLDNAGEMFERPLTLLVPQVWAPENYTVSTLGPGVVVAHSAYFIASFSVEFGAWFLFAAALQPNRYLKVNIGYDEDIQVELEPFGNGVKNTSLFYEPFFDFKQIGERLVLFGAADPNDPFVPREIWLVCGDPYPFLECSDHVFELRSGTLEPGWEPVQCAESERLDMCFLKLFEFELLSGWRFGLVI